MDRVIFVGLGGFLGANARYWLSVLLTRALGQAFPWGTWFVNVTGSMLLAIFLTWAGKQISLSLQARLLIATGFFGAYTTFSTFANDTVALWQAGNQSSAVLNALANNLISVVGVLLGLAIASRLS